MQSRYGVVVIGRNEGDRLSRCLHTLRDQALRDKLSPDHALQDQALQSGDTIVPMVYVDSGSTDNSCELARRLGMAAIELDAEVPFTAARARNTGFYWLQKHYPELEYIQFIDGDCELISGWIEQAITVLDHNSTVAVVCGRRREQFPEKSVYNQLADMEWNTPVGETKACGGDALIRISALSAVGGYNPNLICGEEPEMCIRLRQNGWQIQRIDVDMTLHDAAMVAFGQWWTRSIRGGWAIAQGYAMYGQSPEHYMQRQHWSGILWGILIPVLSISLIWPTRGLSLTLLMVYIILGQRIYHYRKNYGDSPAHARLYAFFCTLSKFPQFIGQMQYWLNYWQGKTATLIEYKQSPELHN